MIQYLSGHIFNISRQWWWKNSELEGFFGILRKLCSLSGPEFSRLLFSFFGITFHLNLGESPKIYFIIIIGNILELQNGQVTKWWQGIKVLFSIYHFVTMMMKMTTIKSESSHFMYKSLRLNLTWPMMRVQKLNFYKIITFRRRSRLTDLFAICAIGKRQEAC